MLNYKVNNNKCTNRIQCLHSLLRVYILHRYRQLNIFNRYQFTQIQTDNTFNAYKFKQIQTENIFNVYQFSQIHTYNILNRYLLLQIQTDYIFNRYQFTAIQTDNKKWISGRRPYEDTYRPQCRLNSLIPLRISPGRAEKTAFTFTCWGKPPLKIGPVIFTDLHTTNSDPRQLRFDCSKYSTDK